MNVKLRVLTAGAVFFIGAQSVVAQKVKKDSVKEIEEVVMVAFGKQKKEAVVGAVSSVSQSVIANQQATSVVSAIQGTVPGVNLVTSGGQPGTNPSIRIRGYGSINASQDPLIILDGAPFYGNINAISQDQIETMNVLKDASSTSLYGSRGANGVILITTKTGKRNMKPQLSLNVITGVSTLATDIYPFVSSDRFMELSWEARRNTAKYVDGKSDVDAALFATNTLISDLGYNPYNVAMPVGLDGKIVAGAVKKWDTDWKKEILNKVAFRKDYRLSLQGGGDNTTYFFSADYLDQEGSVVTSNFKRLSTRLNLDSKVNSWLSAGFKTMFTTSSQNTPLQDGAVYGSALAWIYGVSNIYPVHRRDSSGNLIYDSKGNLIYDYGANGGVLNGNRPIIQNENVPGALYNNKIDNRRYSLNTVGYIEAKLAKGLTNRTTISHEFYVYDYNRYNNNEYGGAANVRGRVSSNRDFSFGTNLTNLTNYKLALGKHNLSVDGIFEVFKYKYNPFGASTTGFLPGVYVHNGGTVYENISGYVNEERMVSYLGRVSYDYGNKYFLEGSFRKDGSSKFSPEVRWGDFYSVGGAWLVSRENFLKDSKVVSNLKLRGSYGELGNNNGIGYFPYIQAYNGGWNQLGNTGVLLGSVVDPMLTWEKTSSLNAGIELGLFDNRINVNVDYYEKKSLDLIYDKPIPWSTGNSTIKTNIGSLKNYGWEFSLNTRNIQNDTFSWRSNLNFSLDRNLVTSLSGGNFAARYAKRYEVGRSLFEFWMPEYAGIDPNDGYLMWYKDIKDANGNVTGMETTKEYSKATRYYTGKSSIPKIIGGLQNTFVYKNLDLNVLFNFSFGGYVYDAQYAGLMSFAAAGIQVTTDVERRWQKPGDVTDVPVLLASQNDFTAMSTRYLFKNDFVRLKALTLGYNVSKRYAEEIGLSAMRLYLQADNIWTWQTHKGMDPEQSFDGWTDNRSLGLRTVSLGFQVSF
ncbi:SusC/RagA family TonB-linked outer membrane protein [Riemerella anatipestifer]|uniref:SusC/RagA family TonB-linked outer membrane protein n=1 Tax=Riemerella anatipestifer TaxID=34085 RepID=UPI00129DFC61|nr:SusC/RagA family TonB-linked outer membrane protein [Riemerella anatipestifer]MRM82812.1 SusC/RagA family TonB-linked outer membrane protein [Riemerella anatipestifer]